MINKWWFYPLRIGVRIFEATRRSPKGFIRKGPKQSANQLCANYEVDRNLPFFPTPKNECSCQVTKNISVIIIHYHLPKAISVTFQASMVSFQWGKRIEHHPALENKPHKPHMSSQEGGKISFWWQIAYGWRVQYCGSPFQNDLSNDSIRPSTLAPSFHPRVEPPEWPRNKKDGAGAVALALKAPRHNFKRIGLTLALDQLRSAEGCTFQLAELFTQQRTFIRKYT